MHPDPDAEDNGVDWHGHREALVPITHPAGVGTPPRHSAEGNWGPKEGFHDSPASSFRGDTIPVDYTAITAHDDDDDDEKYEGPTWKRRLAMLGPGLVVMLADTDAGSLITAAQSGAQWGYSLLSAQIILIPILFVTQELTVRLGVITGKGHGELIKEAFGPFWAWLSVVTLVVACAGAIISEMSGIAAVGEFVNIPKWASALITCVFLITVVTTGSYRSVERVAMMVGAFELVFLITMFASPVNMHDLGTGLGTFPHSTTNGTNCAPGKTVGGCVEDYLFLLSGNIGAVIMPWMIFYQQSAVIDKGLKRRDMPDSKWDTGIGAIITQLVMSSILITTAANLWGGDLDDTSTKLEKVSDIADSLVHSSLGDTVGHGGCRVLFALGMLGASLVASIVVSLTAAWGLGEVAGYKRTLESNPGEAPWFYAVFVGVLLVGSLITVSPVNVVALNIGVQVMNAALLPIVLGFLYVLSIKALPEEDRLKGPYMWILGIIFLACSGFGVMGAVLAAIQGP